MITVCLAYGFAGAIIGVLLLIVIGGCIEAWYPPPRDGGRW